MSQEQAVPEGDPYITIAGHLPNEVRLGGTLITMVDPHVGFERAYNRWYEDDHFYAGVRVGPWWFAGRRWVATRDLQLLRYPADSPIAVPVTLGSYISTYWSLAGHHDDAVRWAISAMSDNISKQPGRTFAERTHVYTTFGTYEFGVIRDTDTPMRPEHALDHPFRGLVVEIIDAGDEAGRGDLRHWLHEEFVPRELAGTPAAMCLGFFPAPRPRQSRVGVTDPPGLTQQITLLWFLDVDPRECWSHFKTHGDAIAGGSRGQVLLAAPFVPTIPGTHTYADELR
jgi:hypothetical protein